MGQEISPLTSGEPMLDWIVVGAGPAGIAAIGKLIDRGAAPSRIGWIDPQFAVGDLGLKWSRVPSNTKVALFLRFLNDCSAFSYDQRPAPFLLDQRDLQSTCILEEMVAPLQWVANHLKNRVSSHTDWILSLHQHTEGWELRSENKIYRSKKVILATGSIPVVPEAIPPSLELISLETALDPEKLARACCSNDTIAVFGSSHSAFLILAYLHKLGIQTVNFYRSLHRYAVEMDGWILHDNTGLKGFTAEWAKKHIDEGLPPNLTRIHLADPLFEKSLSRCNKSIYAIGFTKRTIPVIQKVTKPLIDGELAPNLFGFGIAYPQTKRDPNGNIEQRVGLWKFMDYLNEILPSWLARATL